MNDITHPVMDVYKMVILLSEKERGQHPSLIKADTTKIDLLSNNFIFTQQIFINYYQNQSVSYGIWKRILYNTPINEEDVVKEINLVR